MATFKPIAINEEGVELAYNEGQYIVATKAFTDGTNNYEPGVYVDMMGGRQQLTMQGPQGPQGATGATGETGPRGANGPAGPQGVQGERGAQGIQGIQGPAGVAGPMGAQGVPGKDGRNFETPKIEADTAELLQSTYPPDATRLGETAWVGTITPKIMYSCVQLADGTFGWTEVGSIQGPPGPQGPQGETGATGEQGPQGEIGPQGIQGPQGATGATGETGPRGANGPAGPQGVQGERGEQGPEGPRGPQGLQGPRGYGLSPRTWVIEGVDDGASFPHSINVVVDGDVETLTFEAPGDEVDVYGAVIYIGGASADVSPVSGSQVVLYNSGTYNDYSVLRLPTMGATKKQAETLISVVGDEDVFIQVYLN